MVKKVNQAPTLDLHILRNMLVAVENLPRFLLLGKLQSEGHHRFGISYFKSLIVNVQVYLRRMISIPIQRALQIVSRALRWLYRVDQRIHDRNPRILNVLTDLLHSAENIQQIVHSFKPIDESVKSRFRIP